MHWSTRFVTLIVFLAAFVNVSLSEEIPETLQTFADPRSSIDVCIQRESLSKASLDIELDVQSLGSQQVFPAGSAIITRKLLKSRRIQDLHVEHTFINDSLHGLYITLDGQEIPFQSRIDRKIWKTAYKFHQLVFHVQGKIKNVTCMSEININSTSNVYTYVPIHQDEVYKGSTLPNTDSGFSLTPTTFSEEFSSTRTALCDQDSTLKEVSETLQTYTDPRSEIEVCIQRESSSKASLDIELEVQSKGSQLVFLAGSAIITRRLLKARRIQDLHVEHTFINDTVHGLYITLDGQEIPFQSRIDTKIWKTAYKFHQLVFHVQGKIQNVTCMSKININSTSKVYASVPIHQDKASKLSTLTNTESGFSPTPTTFFDEFSTSRTALSDQDSTLAPNHLEWLWILGEINGIPLVLLIILGSMLAAILIGSIICCCCCECKKKNKDYEKARERNIIGNIIHTTMEEGQCLMNNAPQVPEDSFRTQIHPGGYHSLQLLHGNKRSYINSAPLNIVPNDNSTHTPVTRKFSVPTNHTKFSPKLPPRKRLGEATDEFKYYGSKSNNSSLVQLNTSKPDLIHDHNRGTPVSSGSLVSRGSQRVDYIRNSSPHSLRMDVNSSPHTVMMDTFSNQYFFPNISPSSVRRTHTAPEIPEAVYDEPYDCVNSKRISLSGMSTFKRNSNNNQ